MTLSASATTNGAEGTLTVEYTVLTDVPDEAFFILGLPKQNLGYADINYGYPAPISFLEKDAASGSWSSTDGTSGDLSGNIYYDADYGTDYDLDFISMDL